MKSIHEIETQVGLNEDPPKSGDQGSSSAGHTEAKKIIDLPTLLAPLKHYPTVFEAAKDKGVEETRIALLQQISSNPDTAARKAVHSVLIEMEWQLSEKPPECLILFDEMTPENKSQFIILLSGFDDSPSYHLYLAENLKQWIRNNKTHPHTRTDLNGAQAQYLMDVHGIILNNPLGLEPVAHQEVADVPARHPGIDMFHNPFEYIKFYWLICVVLGSMGCILVYAGFLTLLYPASSFIHLITARERDTRSAGEEKKGIYAIFHISEDNKKTGYAYAITYLALFSTIFVSLLVTGVAQNWAEDFIESPMGDKGMNKTYFEVCFAAVTASVPLLLLILLGGKSLENRVNLLFGEGQGQAAIVASPATIVASTDANERQLLLMSRVAQSSQSSTQSSTQRLSFG